MEDALKNSVPTGLFDLYDEAVERISQKSPDLKRLMLVILSWIFHAKRHLKMFELQAALSIRDGDTDKTPSTYMPPFEIVEICASLVQHDTISGSVRFSHDVVRQFLKDRYSAQLLSEMDVGKTCLTYLSFQALEEGECLDEESFNLRIETYPFAQYAAFAWGEHVQDLSIYNSDATRLLVRLSQSPAQAVAMAQLRYNSVEEWNPVAERHRGKKLIHIIAENNLLELGKSCLTSDSPPVNPRFSHLTVGYWGCPADRSEHCSNHR